MAEQSAAGARGASQNEALHGVNYGGINASEDRQNPHGAFYGQQQHPGARGDAFSMGALGAALPEYQAFANQAPQQRYSQSTSHGATMAYSVPPQYANANPSSNPSNQQQYSAQLHGQQQAGMYNSNHSMAHQQSMMNAAQYYQNQNYLLQHALQGGQSPMSPYYGQHAHASMLGAGSPHGHFNRRAATTAGHANSLSPVGDAGRARGADDRRTSVVRGPPRKPKQSGHAIWIGNLPPQTDLMSLVQHVCKEAAGLESLFLISKSNCAFANFKDETACAEAQGKIHDSRFQTVRLVSRLRRSGGEKNGNVTLGSTGGTLPNPSSNSSSGPEGSGHVTPHVVPKAITETADAATLAQDKYFIVKSLTLEDLELSVRNGIWATQSHNEAALNQAFKSASNVYLVFSANKSGEYFGYARMTSPINDDPAAAVEFAPSAQTNEDPEVPRATPTAANDFVPKGRIIDDSARGTIFWEVDRDDDEDDDTTNTNNRRGDDTASQKSDVNDDAATLGKTWGKPFKLEWLSVTRLPFYRTRGLRNPWNSNREVKIARDGTELETNVGRRLISLFHRSPSPVQPMPPPQQQHMPGMPHPGYAMAYPQMRPFQ